ncbi:MAG TPA: hypothetical protein VND89_10235 [Acidimicrobiales bacterium]|nr:hypothetical protein [Acidimicrobiales bacterium]
MSVSNIDREFVSGDSSDVGRAGAGGRPCQGVYYRPAGQHPKVAIIATHYDIDFSEHYLADLMAQRGFGFLGWNTRFRGAGAYFLLEQALVDTAVGVRYLREQGVETVVILGNSGGGSLMAAYQAQAVHPVLHSNWVATPPTGLDHLPPADLYISLNAHPGRPDVFTAWLDPAVTDEEDPLAVDPALDMFDPANGPPYSPEFIERYREGQVARNNRITKWAQEELVRVTAAGTSDRMFLTHRGWADLRCEDLTIEPTDRQRGCYRGDTRSANYSAVGVGRVSTLRTWLSMWSLETSPCRVINTLPWVTIPALVIQSTADEGVFPSDADELFDRLGAEDKTKMMIPGNHYFTDTPNGRDGVADLIAEWLHART